MKVSRSIHVAANGIILPFVMASKIIIHCIYDTTHLPYCSVDGHSGRFHVLAIVNRAAVSIRVHVPFGIMVFSG